MIADRDVETLDPHASGGVFQTQNLLANVYEGLVRRDRDLRLEGALATAWSNPDDVTWDFALRPGVRFHGGREMTADDVVASLLRARDEPRSVVRSALANVVAIDAPAPGHVRLRCAEPDVSLLSRLPDVYVASRAWLEKGARDGSAGTGPYRVAARDPGRSVTLRRFDGYYGPPPAFATVHVLPWTFGSPEAERDVPPGAAVTFYTPPGTPLHAQAAQDYRLHERAGAGVQFLGFDLRDRESPGVRLRGGRRGNPFRDPRVRAAIALAIDYPRLQRTAGGAHAVLASQVVAPYVLGFDSTLPEPRHAPGAARQLMAQSSHPDGFEVDLDVRALVSSYVPTIVESLAAIGIRVQPRTLPDEAYFEKLRAGGSSLYLLRYTSRTGDAQEMLDKMLHARDEARGHGVFNFSFDRPAVEGLDAAIEEARRTVEPARRLDRLRAVMRRVHEEHLMVPLLGEPSLVFTSRDVAFTPRADAYRIFAEMAPVSR